MTPRRATSVGKYATIPGPSKAVKSRRAALLIKMVEDQRRKHKEEIQDRHGRTEHEAAKFAEALKRRSKTSADSGAGTVTMAVTTVSELLCCHCVSLTQQTYGPSKAIYFIDNDISRHTSARLSKVCPIFIYDEAPWISV